MKKRKQVKLLLNGPIKMPRIWLRRNYYGLNCPQCGAPKVGISLFRIATMFHPLKRAGYHYACGMKTRCLYYPTGPYNMAPGWHIELVADCSIVGPSPRVN